MDSRVFPPTPLAIIATLLFSSAPAAVLRAEPPPATRPAGASPTVDLLIARLPELTAPSKDCPPFIARGVMPESDGDSDGYAYEIVWTGTKYRAAMLDPDDGTPLIVTSHGEMLVCDVFGGRFFRVGPARFAMVLTPDTQGPASPLFRTGHRWSMQPREDRLPLTRFDLREAVRRAAARSSVEVRDDGLVQLIQRTVDPRVRVIAFDPPPSRNVAVAQYRADSPRVTSYHELLLDGVDFEHPRLRFPDAVRLDQELDFQTAIGQQLVEAGRFQMAGHLGRFRRAIRGDATLRQSFERRLGPQDWDALARRDREMVTAWTAALARQGTIIAGPTPIGPTTRPVRP